MSKGKQIGGSRVAHENHKEDKELERPNSEPEIENVLKDRKRNEE